MNLTNSLHLAKLDTAKNTFHRITTKAWPISKTPNGYATLKN